MAGGRGPAPALHLARRAALSASAGRLPEFRPPTVPRRRRRGVRGARAGARAELADGCGPREPIAPNLLARKFAAEAPDRAWVADTTYLPVLGGFLFLVVNLDLFSRKVVGWSLGDHLDAELSGEALRRAIASGQPEPGLLFHSDRGSEFAAQSFRHLLAQIGAVQSMSRKGDCCRRRRRELLLDAEVRRHIDGEL
ncbi:MAG TPA: DDE-type integrase/transposase/recombinase, partial [Anaeromyxobacteraceae bacterium]